MSEPGGRASDAASRPRGGAILDWTSSADGIALRVRRRPGAPLAVVAPLGCWLADAIEDAAPGRAVLAYDPRGRGESGPLADGAPVGIERDVADLERLMARVSGPVAGVGWGYYGAVLAAFAARWPDRVERLALISPLPLTRDPGMAVARARLRRSTAHRGHGGPPPSPLGVEEGAIDVFGTANAGPFADPLGLESERPAELAALLARLERALGAWDWRAIATGLGMPMLVIHGGLDVIGVEWARQWVQLADRAKLFVMSGATRYPWLECPGYFTAALAHFLGDPEV